MPPSRKPPNFEKALADLEALVERMEEGEMSLEDSLKAFENGIRLTRQCQQALSEAQQRVQVLMQQDGELRAFSLDGEPVDAAGASEDDDEEDEEDEDDDGESDEDDEA